MKNLTFIIVMFLIITFAFDCAHATNPDRLYKKGKYKEAESSYEKLDLENPKNISYRYNKGCAAYQLKDYKKAQEAFISVYQRSKDDDMRFRAAYNLGNTAFMAGDMQSAVSFYKEALRTKPGSGDARNNLELALRKMKEEEEKKKQQQQQNQQNRNGQDSKQQKDQSGNKQQNGQQENRDTTGKDQSGQKQQGENKQQQQQQNQQQPQNLAGELKAVNPAQVDKQGKTGQKQQQVNSPARAQAEALLGNIQEDRSRFHQNQSQQDNGSPKSGKYW
jgi:Ca-activated chloride channel homolog